MRPASPALLARLGQETTTTAWLVRITRLDGAVLGFTTHDDDLPVGGVVYRASHSFTPSPVDAKSDLSVSNLQLTGVLGTISGDGLTEDDLAAGLYDEARLDVMLCDWMRPDLGTMPLLRAFIGDATVKDGQYQLDVRSLSETLQKSRGRVITPQCDATLGDGRCGVDLAPFTVSGVVSATDGGTTIAADALGGRPDDYWGQGVLTWTAGANAGSRIEVRSSSGTGAVLWMHAPRPIAPGDAFTVHPGCDHEYSTGCKKFGAGANLRFRGFRDVPGLDAVLAYPDAPPG